MERRELAQKLQTAWSAETSSDPAWSEQNRALGQCAVTALIVQDYFAGEIVNSVATHETGEMVSHYFNGIGDEIIDLTRQQFPENVTFSEPAPKTGEYDTTREYILSYPVTQARYELLKQRLADQAE
jgi:hypothetical protein